MSYLAYRKIDKGSIYLIISPVGATDLHRQFFHIGHAKDLGRCDDRCSPKHQGRVHEGGQPAAFAASPARPGAQAQATRQTHLTLVIIHKQAERLFVFFLFSGSSINPPICVAHLLLSHYSSQLSDTQNETVQQYY